MWLRKRLVLNQRQAFTAPAPLENKAFGQSDRYRLGINSRRLARLSGIRGIGTIKRLNTGPESELFSVDRFTVLGKMPDDLRATLGGMNPSEREYVGGVAN